MARKNKTFMFSLTINCIYDFKISKSAGAIQEEVTWDSLDGTMEHQ